MKCIKARCFRCESTSAFPVELSGKAAACPVCTFMIYFPNVEHQIDGNIDLPSVLSEGAPNKIQDALKTRRFYRGLKILAIVLPAASFLAVLNGLMAIIGAVFFRH